MKSRIDLAIDFSKRGYQTGAEIGVADGRYSQILCESIPGLKLYCIDPWAVYESWRTQGYQDNAFQQAQEKLNIYNVYFIKKPSIEASLEIEDNSLDFVFIDGGHSFDDVMVDIIIWARKVKKGGIVSLHDYCHFTNSGVIEAVNKYCEIHRIEIKLINRNGKNHSDDRQPVVWWVKK
jgi:SAM-dependent methyltransferase